MYRLVFNQQTNAVDVVCRVADNAFIPFNQDNPDYVAYLAWLALGNTPLPAEE
jgi:hypothetical protein